MNIASLVWQSLVTFWKYRFVDPVYKAGFWCIVIGGSMLTAGPLTLYAVLKIEGIPAWLEFGPQTSAGIGVFVLIVGVVMVVWRAQTLTKKPVGVVILHRCMAGMHTTDPSAGLPPKMKVGHLLRINQDDQDFQRNGVTIDPAGLLQKASNLSEHLRVTTTGHGSLPVAYAGLAPVPLLVTAGYKLTNRQEILILDYDRDAGWHLLDSLDDGKSLNIAPPNGAISTDVAIAVSVSAPISPNDIPDHLRDVCFTVVLDGGPNRDSASSVVKQQRLCRELYDLLAQIRAEYPELQVVHVFLAAQASLAFRIGQTITQSVHPPVRIYQFENRRYTWSVQIEPGNEPCLIEDFEKQAS